ncbi:MAG TPA: SPOR domain-containing protein [Thermoanaerobaculia bacterium]|nr:SPOR domain-containing protein [Thermoanaerobaculia bacterium]
MEEHHAVDDQSHYEISLTAGQAFIAFVLLLLSLAASFAFGLMLGKGQADERLVVRKETPVVTEAALIPKKNAGEIVELGVTADDFEEAEAEEPVATSSATDTTVTSTAMPVIAEEPATATTEAPPQQPPVTTPVVAAPVTSAPAVPHIAQLFSTGDQKAAEALAVKVINRGFNSAYVERGSTDKGPIYRVRVRFNSEAEARAAEPKLREFSKEVWITAK